MKWILCIATLALIGNLHADPRQWAPEGLAVRVTSIIEDYSQASREDGKTLIVWAQTRETNPVVMGQLLAPDGEAMWTDGGIILAQGERRAGAPVAVAVGNEWVIAWQDADIIATGRAELGWNGASSLRLIRIDDNGAPVWANGRAGFELVPFGEWWDVKPYMLFESGDGVIVAWQQTFDHWAQRINADGERVWPEDVRLKARMNSRQPAVASDHFGGLVFEWWQVLTGDTMLFANRLLQDGTFAWNDTSGVVVHTSDQFYTEETICGDGLGGAFVVWQQTNESISDPHAQYINAQGNLVWSANGGVVLADLTGYRNIKAISPSFSGDVQDGLLVLMYEDDPASPSRLVVQKVAPDGTQPWGANGITICSSMINDQYFNYATLNSDYSGGALCCIAKDTESEPHVANLLVKRIAADGTFPWGEECGVAVDTTQSSYNFVFVAPNIMGDGVQVTWFDLSYSTPRTIQAQRLDVTTGALEYTTPLMLASSDNSGVQDIQAVKLSNGSTAVVWRTWTVGEETLLFQIIDVFGTPMFGDEGMFLTMDDAGHPLQSSEYALCPDGGGGFFAVYRHYEGALGQVRMVHLNGQGEYLSDAEGVIQFAELNIHEMHGSQVISDGNGGCFVTSEIYDENYYLLIALMRVDAQCQPMWDAPVVYEDPLRDLQSMKLIPSENGSCIWIYTPIEFGTVNVRAARISGDGDVIWSLIIESAANSSYYNSIVACTDAANGAYVIWEATSEDGEEFRTRLQHLSPAGERLWGNAGLTLADTIYQARYYSCDADQVGNLTFAWQQYNGHNNDIRAQRVSRTGEILWPAGGLPLSVAEYDQNNPTVVVLSDNEVYVLWNDERRIMSNFWETDIYGTHVNARGEIGDDSYWQENGSPVCDNTFAQRQSLAIADGAGGVVVAWLDQRTTINFENAVFAQRLYDPIFTDVEEAPVTPTEFSLSQNYPNPFNPETVIEFALPTSSKASIKVFDVTGREVATLLDEPLSAGVHRVNFDAQKLASGVYFYTLKTADRSMTKKMVMLK